MYNKSLTFGWKFWTINCYSLIRTFRLNLTIYLIAIVFLKIYAALEIRHGNSIALQSAVINLWKMNGIKNYKNHKIIDVNCIKFFSLHFPKICYVFSEGRTAIKAALALCFRCIKKHCVLKTWMLEYCLVGNMKKYNIINDYGTCIYAGQIEELV